MEFLDDLREQREAGKRDPKKAGPSLSSADPDEDPWEALLAEASSDTSEGAAAEADAPRTKSGRAKSRRKESRRKAKAPKSRQKGTARQGMSGGQKALLGGLALLVVLLWIGVAGVLLGLLPLGTASGDSPSHVAPPPDADLLPLAEPETSTPTLAAFTSVPEGVQATAAPQATPTPIPVPAVSTVYDLQILRDPGNVDLYLQRGAVYLSLGVYEAAASDYELAMTLDAQRFEPYLGLGWSLYHVFRWDDAQAAFEGALALNPEAAEAYFARGLMHYYQGAYAEAARHFDTAADIDPSNAEAEAWLAISVAHVGDQQEVTDAVERALNVTQKLPVVYVARSWSQRIQDPPNLEGAHADLLYARDLAPNQFLTLNALAAFYAEYRPDRLSEAELRAIHAGEWAADDVERAVALQTLGRVYLALERNEDAEQVLRQAIDLATVGGKTYLVDLPGDLERAQQ